MDPQTFFERIGRFCVAFEHCCLELEDFAIELLEDAGIRDEDTAHILLADLTAAPLANLVRPLFSDRLKHHGNRDALVEAATLVFRSFSCVTTLRNVVVHAKWIEPLNDPQWRRPDGLVIGRKIKSNKQGSSTLYPRYGETDLTECVAACEKTEKLIGRLRHAFAKRSISQETMTDIKKTSDEIGKAVSRLEQLARVA